MVLAWIYLQHLLNNNGKILRLTLLKKHNYFIKEIIYWLINAELKPLLRACKFLTMAPPSGNTRDSLYCHHQAGYTKFHKVCQIFFFQSCSNHRDIYSSVALNVQRVGFSGIYWWGCRLQLTECPQESIVAVKPTQKLKRRFRLLLLCLTSCFSVGTWESTTKHSASVASLTTNIHCVF